MQKLSPHYRNDDIEGLPTNIEDYLDTHYFEQLEHLNMLHPKLLVVFSGGSAVGKSALSQRIKHDLQALVLENDAIKRCLKQLNPNFTTNELSKITWQYSMKLYPQLPNITRNGLIVRDGVIDWYYDRILPNFIERGYQLFIIAYDLSEEKCVELIKKRGDTEIATVEQFVELLQDHDIHMKRFRSEYTPDIVLHDNNLFEYESVIRAIQNHLKSLQR